MSTTEFKDDLTERAVYDEPRRSSNAGMNLALLITIPLALIVFFVIAFSGNSKNVGPRDSAAGPVQTVQPRATFHNNREIQTDNDKTYTTGGWAVQGDAIMNHGK